jgi:hypothetical protein
MRRCVDTELTEVNDVIGINLACVSARVNNRNAKASDKIRLLAHMGDYSMKIKSLLTEYDGIRLEADDGTVSLGGTNLFYGSLFLSLGILLHVLATILMNLNLTHDGKRVHHRRTHTVKTSGYLVARVIATELSSGMEYGHDGFKGRHLGLLVDVYGNSSSVIDNTNNLAWKKGNFNVIGMTTHGLISTVVENLGYEMVKTIGTSGTNVHSRTLSHWFETLKNLNGFRSV